MVFKPGQSGNKLGRPIGAKGLSKKIGKETRDADELIERLLEMARSPRTPAREKLSAISILLERYAGRPLSTSEVSLTLSERPLGETILLMAPENRLAFLDGIRAKKQLGPDYEDQDEEVEIQETNRLEHDE